MPHLSLAGRDRSLTCYGPVMRGRWDNDRVSLGSQNADPAVLRVDLDAVTENAAFLQSCVGDAKIMAVVKANAYGLGRTEVAAALQESGVTWFGVSHFNEALALRRSFDDRGIPVEQARIFSWLGPTEASWAGVLEAGIDVSVSSLFQLQQVRAAFDELEGGAEPARIHLKVDVGMGRGGVTTAELSELSAAILEAERAGDINLVGFWSHLPEADNPDHTVTNRQIDTFLEARELVRSCGLNPELSHLSATGGALWHPRAHFDLVRVGIGLYGLSPAPELATSDQLGLKPAATFTSRIGQVKRLGPGQAVSYGGTWVADRPTWVGLLPVGYADGVPRSLSSQATFHVLGEDGATPARVLGRVCMDQVVIDLGDQEQPAAEVGQQVVLFGDSAEGFTSADDWAKMDDSINYEVISTLPAHLSRDYGK